MSDCKHNYKRDLIQHIREMSAIYDNILSDEEIILIVVKCNYHYPDILDEYMSLIHGKLKDNKYPNVTTIKYNQYTSIDKEIYPILVKLMDNNELLKTLEILEQCVCINVNKKNKNIVEVEKILPNNFIPSFDRYYKLYERIASQLVFI